MSETTGARPPRSLGAGSPTTAAEIIALASAARRAPITLSPLGDGALIRLCEGYARRPFGRRGRTLTRTLLLDAVLKHAALHDALAARPEMAASPFDAPLFIVSAPRTASTFLHRLLARHPAFTAPRAWETAYAAPSSDEKDARPVRLAGALAAIRRLSPALLDLHPVSIDEPEECFALLETSLISPSFVYHGAPEGYEAWIDTLPDAAWDEVYRVYANQLRMLSIDRGGRRWILKSSAHLFGLGALLRAFPGARVVWIHRRSDARIASFRRLLEAHHALYMASIDVEAIDALAAAHLERSLARAVAARRGAPDRFLDVDFDELVSAPAGVAERISAWAEAPADASIAARFRGYVADHPRPRTVAPPLEARSP